MTESDLHSSNPFEEPLFRRLQITNKNKLTLYDQFIKNLIAALYYQDFKVKNFPPYMVQKKSQVQLYEQYVKGNLRILDFDEEPISPLTRFMNLELKALENEEMREAKKYKNFMIAHKKVFKCIDRAVDYSITKQNWIDCPAYIHNKVGNIQYLAAYDIQKTFNDLEIKLVTQLKKQLIANLDIQGFDPSDINEELDALAYHFNNELIDSKTTYLIKVHSVQWLGQLLRHIGFEIGWQDYKGFFDNVKELYCKAIGYEAPRPKITDIPYPEHIFTKPEAYLLFHDVASKVEKKSPISYLYRKMAEKDNLIRVRDTEFRDWFTSCNYPAPLYSTTETYDRAHTEEREAFVELLYKKYKLP